MLFCLIYNILVLFQLLIKPILIRKLSYIICTVLFIAACSTEKDAFVNRSYHYTTARFNGYFHGREALKLAQKNIAQNHEDDFEQILDVFQYGSEKINNGEITNLNRAVQKGAKMIDRHSMKFQKKKKKVEVNQMIDDCYLLIGKARFFKNDFESAAQTFKFIIKQFPEAKLRFDAQLWLVKTYIHQENFVDAETELQALSENQDLPKTLRDDLEATKAYYFIKS